jgi:hypothetical protein
VSLIKLAEESRERFSTENFRVLTSLKKGVSSKIIGVLDFKISALLPSPAGRLIQAIQMAKTNKLGAIL